MGWECRLPHTGIALDNADNGFINDNQALENGICDANSNSLSTGNSWSGNYFGTTCGNVPASH